MKKRRNIGSKKSKSKRGGVVWKTLAALVVIAGGALGVKGLWGEDAGIVGSEKAVLPSEHHGRVVAESSAEKNERYAKEEAQMTKEELDELGQEEAPSEGLSQLDADNLELAAEITNAPEIKLFKSQFTVSYNTRTRCPNYVAWELTADRTQGGEKRADDFQGDPVLQESLRVVTGDYSRSGYDRGHMCPAGDNKNSRQAMMESFFMTNICPQAHRLNIGDWNELENQCRSWAKNYGSVYIACGPIFDSENPRTIGNRKDVKVSVPDRFFKVVMMLGDRPKAIGFIMPNDDVNGDLRDYVVSVDEVERITGFDFFYQIKEDVQTRIEAECKPAEWGI